jgi:hypothetical protein
MFVQFENSFGFGKVPPLCNQQNDSTAFAAAVFAVLLLRPTLEVGV